MQGLLTEYYSNSRNIYYLLQGVATPCLLKIQRFDIVKFKLEIVNLKFVAMQG